MHPKKEFVSCYFRLVSANDDTTPVALMYRLELEKNTISPQTSNLPISVLGFVYVCPRTLGELPGVQPGGKTMNLIENKPVTDTELSSLTN